MRRLTKNLFLPGPKIYPKVDMFQDLKISKDLLHEMLLLMMSSTSMQILKSVNTFVFTLKQYVEDFTLKHLSRFEIRAREICDEKFVYKHEQK